MSEKEFTTAERIALTVALETMHSMAWDDQPEMLLDKILLTNAVDNVRQYRVLFSLFGERQNLHKVEVTIRAQTHDGRTRWVDGVVMAFHWIVPTPYLSKFAVVWTRGTPRVRLEPFAR